MVGAHGGRAHIDADALPRFLDVPVEQPEQGHLGFHASLEKVPHVRSAEIAFPFLQFIECRMDGQQQFLDFRIGLHRLAALSFQTVFTHVPQLGRARELGAELRHRPVQCDASHDGSFARLVGFGLLQKQQDLEFLNFHTPTFF